MPFGLYNLIYTLLSTDLLEKLIVPQPVEEIPQILWNLNVHYCIHNRTPLVLILSHMNPAHTLLFVYDSLMPWSSTWFISFRFFYQNIICTSFLPTRAICPTHLIVLHLIAQWYLVRTIHKVLISQVSQVSCYFLPHRFRIQSTNVVQLYVSKIICAIMVRLEMQGTQLFSRDLFTGMCSNLQRNKTKPQSIGSRNALSRVTPGQWQL